MNNLKQQIELRIAKMGNVIDFELITQLTYMGINDPCNTCSDMEYCEIYPFCGPADKEAGDV